MRRQATRRGGNAIEFALLFPLFWLLLGGGMDIGWLYYHQAMLDTATNTGCRAGSLIDPGWAQGDMAIVEQTAQEAMSAQLNATPGTVCDTSSGDCSLFVTLYGDPPGRSLVCSVERSFEPLLGIAARPTKLGSRIAVRMEWQRW